MSAWEREYGELPSPIWSLLSRKVGQGLFVFCMRVEVAEVLTWLASRRRWRNHRSKRAEKASLKTQRIGKAVAERPCYEADDSACVAHSVGKLAAPPWRGAQC